MFLNRFLEIGFKQSKPETWSGAGWCIEYTYYPNYLGDNHYTLVTFTRILPRELFREEGGIRENTEYRLYIHVNKDGKYVDSKFQLSYDKYWNKKYLDKQFNVIFKLELRDGKLKELLND
jgi:hypothetical protein